jgi:hypothetical protein
MSLSQVRSVGLELPDLKTYNRDIKYLFFDAPGKLMVCHQRESDPFFLRVLHR